VLLALGLITLLGAAAVAGVMFVAIVTVHWRPPSRHRHGSVNFDDGAFLTTTSNVPCRWTLRPPVTFLAPRYGGDVPLDGTWQRAVIVRPPHM
jgi:hypothetical protein